MSLLISAGATPGRYAMQQVRRLCRRLTKVKLETEVIIANGVAREQSRRPLTWAKRKGTR